MTDVAKLEKLRPCGRLETYSTSRHYLGYYNNVCMAATYHTPSSILSLEASIYAALKQVITKHTILSALPVDEVKSHPDVYFARLSSIDLRSNVEFRERTHSLPGDGEADEELDQLLIDNHNRNFKEDLGSKPFWRFAVLNSAAEESIFTAVWVFHHALADGTSAMLFHDTFLAALNAPGPNPDTSTMADTPTTPLPPPLEEQHSMGLSWPFFLNAVAKSILPALFDKRPEKLWTGSNIPKEIKSAPQFKTRTMVFSSETTKQLALLSRKQGVTVTATLQALLSASLFLHLPATEIDKIKINGPIAMRPFLEDVPDDQMTNAITSYEIMHHRPITTDLTGAEQAKVLNFFSWNEASVVKSAIQTAVVKKGSDNPIALLKYVSNIHDFVASGLGKPRKLTAEMSNIGLYKAKTGGQWKIGRMTLSQCANPADAAFHVNVMTGGDGNASLNANWCEGAVDEEFLSRILDSLKEGVLALVEEFEC